MQQRTWSKYKSSIDGPVKTRQDLYKNLPSSTKMLYGSLTNVRGDESYNGEDFIAGLEVKMKFDLEEFNSRWADHWFSLDITYDDFVDKYGDVESVNTRIQDGDAPIKAMFIYKPPRIETGKIRIDSDLKHPYSNNSSSEAFTLSSLMNGFGEQNKKIRKVIKPAAVSKFKTALTIEDGSIKIAATGKNFLQVNEDGISLNAQNVNMQCMPNSIRYGGFVSPQNPYTGLIPSSTTSPIPQYSINLPIDGIASLLDIVKLAGSIVGQ